jgi:hypothetical protein
MMDCGVADTSNYLNYSTYLNRHLNQSVFSLNCSPEGFEGSTYAKIRQLYYYQEHNCVT